MERKKSIVSNNSTNNTSNNGLVGNANNVKKTIPKHVTAVNRIKIISMGSGGCGKSCLIKRYCEDRFVNKYIATIGVDYGVKPIQIEGNGNQLVYSL